MRTRKPDTATIHGVDVVPSVAPMVMPTACAKLASPALMKPITVMIVAVDDWIATVNSAPEATAPKRPDTSVCSARRIESPAMRSRPSVR